MKPGFRFFWRPSIAMPMHVVSPGAGDASGAPQVAANKGAAPSRIQPDGAVHERSFSLRSRLLGLVLASIVTAAVILAAGAYRGALRDADAMADLHLQQVAQSLRSNVPLGALQGLDDSAALDLLVQIWGPDGAQLYRSGRADLPPRAVLGFSDLRVNGTDYRVYSIQTPLQTVQIAQDLDARRRRAQAQALHATVPVLLTLPLLMLAVVVIVRRTLAPVERMRRQVAARAAEDLDALPAAGLPDEVRPLVEELNLLFYRVRGAFAAQRDFVADAAHELRSPLTALRLQVQALQRAPMDDAASRDTALARLEQGIDRAIALMSQLLTLARQDAGAAGSQTLMAAAATQVDLQQTVASVIGELIPQATARRIDLGVAHAEQAVVRGDPQALTILLRNLIDNAIKFTPEGGRVDVAVRPLAGGGGARRPIGNAALTLFGSSEGAGANKEAEENGGEQQVGAARDVDPGTVPGSPTDVVTSAGALLTVDDSGPGIAPANRQRVFDRFFREPDAAAGGSGLGLAIVEAIARQHGAIVTLGASDLGGLRVEVRFE